MMDKKQHDELVVTYREVRRALKSEQLTEEQRKNFENIASRLAGELARSWLPIDWTRRILMIILSLVGFYGLLRGNIYLLLLLVVALFCSPRIVGEVNTLVGGMSRKGSID